MSQNRAKIRESIRELGEAGKYEIYTGEVCAINEQTTTIDVQLAENVILYDVRLKSVIDNNKGGFF